MAVQNPFFGKRDNDPFAARSPVGGNASPLATSAGGMGTGMGSSNMGRGPGSAGGMASTAPAATEPEAAAAAPGGSKLTVGPNIKLKGVEITDCDTLVVEGTVEATMDSRVIQIAEQGAFHGTADIDIAEIRGVFEGTLTVREKLVIYGTGKVSGTIRYGKLVVEEGGQLTGTIEVGGRQPAGKPGVAVASSAVATAASASSADSNMSAAARSSGGQPALA